MLSSSIAVSAKAWPSVATTSPLLSLQRSLDDGEAALHHFGQRGVELLARRLADGGAERAHLDEAVGQAAAGEVGQRLAGHELVDEHLVDLGPVPFGAGEVFFRRQRALVGVVAADEGAAAGGRLDHHLRAVDMAGDDVGALVDQRVGGFRLLDRQRPFAGEDHLAGDGRVDRARAEQEGVDVEQHLRDRLGGDEAELLGLRGVAGDDAVQILAHADIAEIGAGIHRMLVLVPHAAAMAELHVGEFRGHGQHVRVEIAEGGREDQRGAVEVDHRFHRLLDVDRLGNVLLLDDGDALDALQRRRTLGMRLVVAVVVLRADIDEADGGSGGEGRLTERHAEARPSAAPAAEVLSSWRRLSMNLSVISYAPLLDPFPGRLTPSQESACNHRASSKIEIYSIKSVTMSNAACSQRKAIACTFCLENSQFDMQIKIKA